MGLCLVNIFFDIINVSSKKDLHKFSSAMASACVRSVIESLVEKKSAAELDGDIVIITGKGNRSEGGPVLSRVVFNLLQNEYRIQGKIDDLNEGRIILGTETLRSFLERVSW